MSVLPRLSEFRIWAITLDCINLFGSGLRHTVKELNSFEIINNSSYVYALRLRISVNSSMWFKMWLCWRFKKIQLIDGKFPCPINLFRESYKNRYWTQIFREILISFFKFRVNKPLKMECSCQILRKSGPLERGYIRLDTVFPTTTLNVFYKDQNLC